MQSNFPFHHDSGDVRLPQSHPSSQLKAMYVQDHERWSKRTLTIAKFRLYRKLRPWIDAEDINQDVWLAAWIHYGRMYCCSEGHRWNWLVVTTKRKVIDAHRLVDRKNVGVGSDRASAADPTAVDLEPIVDPGARPPFAIACGRELRGAIDKQLDALRPIEQEVIRLRFFAGCEWAAVAHRTNRPIGYCESVARRGRHRLCSMLPSSLRLDLQESLRDQELN